MFGVNALSGEPLPQMGPQVQIPQSAPKKGGMFGSGGKFGMKEALAFGLAGFMARRNPMLMQGLMGAMMQKRQQAAEQEQYGQRREDDFQDYVRREAWDLANKPQQGQQPHYFEDNMGNLQAVGPDGKPYMVHKDPFQWKLVPNGMGGVVPVNIGQLMGGQGQQGLPQTLSDSDWQTEGGPTPQASGGFPYAGQY